MTLLIIVLILALLWVLAVQGRSSHPGMKELRGWNYAHRGLHGDGAAENSMTAFRLAVENGYTGTVREWLASMEVANALKGKTFEFSTATAIKIADGLKMVFQALGGTVL